MCSNIPVVYIPLCGLRLSATFQVGPVLIF